MPNKNIHLLFARKGYYIKGGRVNIGPKLTAKLCSTQQYIQPNFFTRDLIRRENSIRCLLLAGLLATRRKTAPGLGCNMSYWKEDVVRINGYDEFFVGWGGEDYDLAMRLRQLGKKKIALKFAAIGFHLWHNDLYMENRDRNFSYYYQKMNEKDVYCKNGIDQYLQM